MRGAPAQTHDVAPIVTVDNLGIVYRGPRGTSTAARNVTFSLGQGEIFGLVGETGSGKSTVLRSIIGLLHRNAFVEQGTIVVAGHDVTGASKEDLMRLRRSHMAMVFQDPLRALNPVMTVGAQLAEGVRVTGERDATVIRRRILDALDQVGIADPAIRMRAFPHELSGGLRQRVSIAAAIIRSPALLLADEPTTALDVTIQDQILTLLRSLCRDLGMSVILVTHDMGVVAETCDKVGVMYAGQMVETGDVATVLATPSHPYTSGLMGSIPRLGEKRARLQVIEGRPPDLSVEMSGCPFASRCAYRLAECDVREPVLAPHGKSQATACWRHDELRQTLVRGMT
jgi:oligopeptide/dipeptide ABC transporter ATP-binding protein